MHTVITAFDTQDEARRALDRLVDAGIPRADVHIEHRKLYGEDGAMRPHANWEGMESEIAIDRGLLSSVGHFFASILGLDHPAGRVDTYAQHVEQGRYVLVMDGRDADESRRIHDILDGLGARDTGVVHRPEQTPVRDLVAARQARAPLTTPERLERFDATARESDASLGERAMANAEPRVRPSNLPGDDDLKRSPGLRYSDLDEPGKPR